jgi:hypothetical protein
MARNQMLLLAKHGGRDWVRRYPRQVVIGQALWGLAAARRGRLLPWLRGKRTGLAAFRQASPGIAPPLEEFENELFAYTHADPFWRLYWALSL